MLVKEIEQCGIHPSGTMLNIIDSENIANAKVPREIKIELNVLGTNASRGYRTMVSVPSSGTCHIQSNIFVSNYNDSVDKYLTCTNVSSFPNTPFQKVYMLEDIEVIELR